MPRDLLARKRKPRDLLADKVQEPPPERQTDALGIPVMTPGVDRNPFADAVGALGDTGVTPEQEKSGEWRRGTLAPVIRNENTGELRLAWPQIALDVADAVTLPGDVAGGKEGLQVDLDRGIVTPNTDDVVARGAAAGALMAGGNAAPATKVVLSETPRIAAKTVSRETGLTPPAAEAVTRALQADEALSSAGTAALKESGADAMLAEAGPATSGLLDTAIQRSGPGATAARKAIEDRAAAAQSQISAALDEALGPALGVKATETAIRKGTAGVRDAVYREAYAAPLDYAAPTGREIEALVKRVPADVIKAANRLMQIEGEQSATIMAQIADDGTVTFMRMPDVRQLDYITRALNTAAKSGEGQGTLGGQTDIGRAYANLSREIRDSLKAAVPEYARALETAAKPIQAREALRFGEGILSSSVTRSEARELVEGMTGPELKAARQGLRSYIDDVLANVRAVASDPNLDAREARKALQDLSSRAAREKIAMLLDSPEQAEALFSVLTKASRSLELRASVATNSRTYGRLAMDEAVSAATKEGPINALKRGEPINALRIGVQGLTGRTPTGERMLADATYEEIANALTQRRGDAAIDLLSLIANANRQALVPPGRAAPSALFPATEFVKQFDR